MRTLSSFFSSSFPWDGSSHILTLNIFVSVWHDILHRVHVHRATRHVAAPKIPVQVGFDLSNPTRKMGLDDRLFLCEVVVPVDPLLQRRRDDAVLSVRPGSEER